MFEDENFQLVDEPSKEVISLLDEADEHFEKGRIENAEKAYRRVFEYKPVNERAIEALSNLYIQQDKYEKAEAVWEQASDYVETQTWFYLGRMARIYEEKGMLAEAERILRRAVKKTPYSGMAYAVLGAFYENQGRLLDAMLAYRNAAEAEPEDKWLKSNFERAIVEVIETFELQMDIDFEPPVTSLYPSFKAAIEGKVGILWTKVREFAEQGERWAQEKLQELSDLLQGTMALWRPLWGPGIPPAPVPAIGVIGIDASWQPLEVVAFEVEQEPVITKDGEFCLTLRTKERKLQGRKVICTMELVEGGLLSFEAKVEDEQVRFVGGGFPAGDVDIPIPPERLRFYVAP